MSRPRPFRMTLNLNASQFDEISPYISLARRCDKAFILSQEFYPGGRCENAQVVLKVGFHSKDFMDKVMAEGWENSVRDLHRVQKVLSCNEDQQFRDLVNKAFN